MPTGTLDAWSDVTSEDCDFFLMENPKIRSISIFFIFVVAWLSPEIRITPCISLRKCGSQWQFGSFAVSRRWVSEIFERILLLTGYEGICCTVSSKRDIIDPHLKWEGVFFFGKRLLLHYLIHFSWPWRSPCVKSKYWRRIYGPIRGVYSSCDHRWLFWPSRLRIRSWRAGWSVQGDVWISRHQRFRRRYRAVSSLADRSCMRRRSVYSAQIYQWETTYKTSPWILSRSRGAGVGRG